MKYYAVTDDPNELMHYGILGMKWGVLRTPEQLGHRKLPKTNVRKVQSLLKSAQKAQKRSPAYISASDKLRKMTKHGIKKAEANWFSNKKSSSINTAKVQSLMSKAPIKNRKSLFENVKNSVNDYMSPKNRSERLFEKHVQLARQGRLKYKGISDAEVARITKRLDLERQTRQLSGAEQPSFMRRLGSAVSEGFISGVGRGVSNRISERISRGGELKTMRKKQQISDNAYRRRAREDFKRGLEEQSVRDSYNLDREYRRTMAEEGHPWRAKMPVLFESTKQRRLSEIGDAREQKEYERKRDRAKLEADEQERRDNRRADRQATRDDRNAERQMIRDVMRDKRQDTLAVYNAELAQYNKAVKTWRKNGSDPRDEPQRPVRPIFDVDDFFKQYDTYRTKRTR